VRPLQTTVALGKLARERAPPSATLCMTRVPRHTSLLHLEKQQAQSDHVGPLGALLCGRLRRTARQASSTRHTYLCISACSRTLVWCNRPRPVSRWPVRRWRAWMAAKWIWTACRSARRLSRPRSRRSRLGTALCSRASTVAPFRQRCVRAPAGVQLGEGPGRHCGARGGSAGRGGVA